MLPAKNRITKTKDFEQGYKQGKAFYSTGLILKVVKNDYDFFRAGIVISNKISKKAVIRNKIKRRIRAVLGAKPGFLAKARQGGYDYVFIVKKPIVEMDFNKIKENIEYLFKKSGIIRA